MKVVFDHVMQFKITLKGIKPPIWRRIQVPCDYSFWGLHVAIQDALGWRDCHLHLFEIPDPGTLLPLTIGIPLDDLRCLPSWEVPIGVVFTLVNRKATYTYDFGDGWEHSVVLEKVFPLGKDIEFPVCVGGRRACPPENCGGVWGYRNLLEILGDPRHERHEEISEWLGESFDAEAFNPSDVTFDDPDERWEYAFGR